MTTSVISCIYTMLYDDKTWTNIIWLCGSSEVRYFLYKHGHFEILKLLFCLVVAIFDIVHDVDIIPFVNC